jgi:hypothetical protein
MNNKTDILNELKELSPFLLQLKETEKPLYIPVHYFETFTDTIVAEIKAETGLLGTLKKETFAAPPAYFDTFADHIITKIKAEEAAVEKGKITALPKQQNKVFLLFTRVALAASVIGALFFIKNILEPGLPVNNCEDGIACLTQEEIYNYMNANSHDFEVQDVQEAVESVLEKQETKIDMNEKEIEQYIKENNNIIEAEDAATDIF